MGKIPHAIVLPQQVLSLLASSEIADLAAADQGTLRLFRNCALAILNTDSLQDDAATIFAEFADFDIKVIQQSRGLALEVRNAPAQAFVDGKMISGIRNHLFAALRDILYTDFIHQGRGKTEAEQINWASDEVFKTLRNGEIVRSGEAPNLVVCWGGHSISRSEYDYSKEVGYQLGLRGLDIVTGCGIGAMKGPMKGAAVGHAKQQIRSGRYIGISEPGIIASESPNAIVNELVIMPDIEKRLEAFVRLAHSVIVFPGGVGTVEEILYLLAILLHPANPRELTMIFSGPRECAGYFEILDDFLASTLGSGVREHYRIIVDDPTAAARAAQAQVKAIHQARRENREAYYFNWRLGIAPELQVPFEPTHQNMAGLRLHSKLPAHELAVNLRAAFSGIVAGNVKALGIEQIQKHGPYRLYGDNAILAALDRLLQKLVEQKRMKLSQRKARYRPCYQLQSSA